MYILQPLLNVYQLSGLTILFGHIMDINVSKNTFIDYCSKNDKLNLYIEGQQKLHFNLLIVSPLNYVINYNLFLRNITGDIEYLNLFLILMIHNLSYYLLHKGVHKLKNFRFIHDFHHRFKTNIPSIGNAVSYLEFQIMYVLPFLLGSFLLSPNVKTLDTGVAIISFLNTIIHCDELKQVPWFSLFVSPGQHCKHHETYSDTYSAPLINFDKFI